MTRSASPTPATRAGNRWTSTRAWRSLALRKRTPTPGVASPWRLAHRARSGEVTWWLAEAFGLPAADLFRQARLVGSPPGPGRPARRGRGRQRLGHQLGQALGGELLVAGDRALVLDCDAEWALVQAKALLEP